MQELQIPSNIGNRMLADYPQYIRAVAEVRRTAAQANETLGSLTPQQCATIGLAADRLCEEAQSLFAQQGFYRAGSASPLMRITQTMSALADCPVSHLTLNQSITDVTATVAEIVMYDGLSRVIEACGCMIETLRQKAETYADVVKCARVSLQDATAVLVGDELEAYAQRIDEAAGSLRWQLGKWSVSHLGSGDVGTGFMIAPQFAELATERLSQRLGRTLTRPRLPLAELNQDGKFLAAHHALVELAFAIWRLARDLEFLASGPRGGIREWTLPAIAPGSSIMPGKINSTAAQLACATSDQIMADGQALMAALQRSWGVSGSQSLLPVKILMQDTELLARTCLVFNEKVLSGMTCNADKCLTQAQRSLAPALLLTKVAGVAAVEAAVEYALQNDVTVKDAAVSLKLVTAQEADVLFDSARLASVKGNADIMRLLSD